MLRKKNTRGNIVYKKNISTLSKPHSHFIFQNPSTLTEEQNPHSANIDIMPILDALKVINYEDQKVACAVSEEIPNIAEAVSQIVARMQIGGRLIYVGAGTSGRLGVLDASEIPPTYNAPRDLVIGIIAGGKEALSSSIEGAEDKEISGAESLREININHKDSVIGLAASGGTPFVIGALKEANQAGCLTISIACNKNAPIEEFALINITPLVGPEIITGSTRMKAGTAQKLVLNMISTTVMIRLGKTYGNLMVDVQATNNKLIKRAVRIVSKACGISLEAASKILDECGGEVKTAIIMHKKNIDPDAARKRLFQAGGVVRRAIMEE